MENWRIFRRLIGHDNDVQDLGWACDSSILVSVGLDSKIVVWSGYTFEKLKTITSHQSHVKGITFDPANKYFATAGDDRTVQIFRFTPPGPNSTAHDQANNFIKEKEVKDPFSGSPITTYFRRCSWSPDGQHVGCANAVNGPVSSVAILDRGLWGGEIHLIGHELPVEVCAFCPRMWSNVPIEQLSRSASGEAQGLVSIIACAGQDKSISLWITSNSRPIIIAQDLAVKSISDLAWSPDGMRLFATSLDGSIIVLLFKERELGYRADLEENETKLVKYGGSRKGASLLEGPKNLLLEEKSKEGEMRGVENRMGALMGDGAASSQVNGITPSQPESLVNGTKSPLANGQVNGDSTAKAAESQAPAEPTATPQSVGEAKGERMKQRITITKEGKKRVTPFLVSGSSVGDSALPRTQLRTSSSAAPGPSIDAPQSVLDLSKPFDGLPKGGLGAVVLGNRRKLAAIEGDEEGLAEKRVAAASRDGAIPIMHDNANGLTLAKTSSTPQAQIHEFTRPAVVNPSLSVSSVRLAVPKLRATVIRKIDPTASQGDVRSKQKSKEADATLEIKNPTGPSPTGRYEDREPTRVSALSKDQVMWTDFVPKSVLLVAGARQFWAAACEDGSIFAWSPGGRRLVNAMVMESQPVILEARDSWLLCITAVGLAYVWNIDTMTSPHPPVSIAPLLDIATTSLSSHTSKAPSITSAHLNSEGRIIIALTNGDGYTYSPSLYVWQRLSEVWWAVTSQYWNTGESSVGNLKSSDGKAKDKSSDFTSAGIVPYLERSTASETHSRGRAYAASRLVKSLLSREGYENFESSVSISHLENRLAAAMILGSKQEFQSNLYMYAKRLGSEGSKVKTEELLRGLMGSDPSTGEPTDLSDRRWGNSKDTVCGGSRKELLKGVILILGKCSLVVSQGYALTNLYTGKNRDLQRMVASYATILGITDDGSVDEDGDAMIS